MAEKSLADFIRIGWKYIDPSDYVPNWHIEAICEHLEAVSRGEIRRLLINIPPRHMKSLGVSVAWPAWTWAQEQQKGKPLIGSHTQWLFASYAHTLSIRDSVKCRRVIESPWYQENWGHRFQMTGDQNTKIRFDNDQHGYRLSTSVDGALTGEGGDIVVCLPAETIVVTEGGPRRIKEVVEGFGQQVAAYDHITKEIVFRRIQKRMVNPPKSLVEISVEGGNVLRCTEDHPVWIEGKGYIPAGEIQEGDEVLVCPAACTV